MGGLYSSQANPESMAVGCVMDGLPTDCNRVKQAIDRDQAKKLHLLGIAVNPEFIRLSMSFTAVGIDFRPTAPTEPIDPDTEPSLPDGPGFTMNLNGVEIWTLFAKAPGSQAGFTQTPQNTEPHIPARNLLPEVFRLLDNNRCFTFISNLLDVARQLTGKKPYTYDAYELAVTIATRQPDGGVIFSREGDGGGSASGDIFSGTATIGIDLRRDRPNISHVGVQVYYALVALHEFIHLAAGANQYGAGFYSDYVLADAARIYTGAPGYPSGTPRNREEQEKLKFATSDYWDNQLWEHCNPLGARR